jgi:hypothetical protein
MRKNLLAVITILVFGIAPAIAKKPSFYIVSSSKSDKPADSRYALSEAAGAANQLGIYVGIALQDKYPCASTSRDADIATVLGHERDRALLGADISSDELKEIAGTIGADYVVRTQVTNRRKIFSYHSCD